MSHPILAAMLLLALTVPRACLASDAPAWMHQQVNAVLPAHDENTDAVILFEETILTVQPNGKIKRLDRQAFRILRPDGESRGTRHF
ncbi:MAG TPA: hypothetical protein VGD63_06260 [Steroidobacteraceae bacterium]